MDKEGFSGRDGRTTIFDYWSIDTLCRADEGKLTDAEKYIYDTHKKVLQIARKEKAVDGAFYDLMYANPWSARFDNNKQYAFLRKQDNEVLLVVCNFNGNAVDIDVKIPQHAVDFLQIPEKKYTATDLLSDTKKAFTLKGDQSVDMDIPAYSARVWKFSYRAAAKK